jgi:hypothetical protein
VDPVLPYGGGGKGSLFDALEDLDAAACARKCKARTTRAGGPRG